jgi:hypothetical protein
MAPVAVAFWLFAYPWLANTLIPHSWWLDVREVRINNSYDGSSPQVLIDRDINDTFYATLITELRPLNGDGSRVCRRVRERRLFPEHQPFPTEPILLSRLQDVPPNAPCVLENLPYRVDFTWERDAWWWLPGVTLRYTLSSNIFTVNGVK